MRVLVFLGFCVGLGVLVALARALSDTVFGSSPDWITPLIIGPGIWVLTGWNMAQGKKGIGIDPPPDRDRFHRVLLTFVVASTLVVIGAVLTLGLLPEDSVLFWIGPATLFAGLAVALVVTPALQKWQRMIARNPGFEDERGAARQRQATTAAFYATMLVAGVLGVIDMTDAATLSGSAVGLSAWAAGWLTLCWTLAVLEWSDAR